MRSAGSVESPATLRYMLVLLADGRAFDRSGFAFESWEDSERVLGEGISEEVD